MGAGPPSRIPGPPAVGREPARSGRGRGRRRNWAPAGSPLAGTFLSMFKERVGMPLKPEFAVNPSFTEMPIGSPRRDEIVMFGGFGMAFLSFNSARSCRRIPTSRPEGREKLLGVILC